MTRIVTAELLLLGKRASTWILLGIWAALALTFAYVVPYVQYTNNPSRSPLSDLLPESLVGHAAWPASRSSAACSRSCSASSPSAASTAGGRSRPCSRRAPAA